MSWWRTLLRPTRDRHPGDEVARMTDKELADLRAFQATALLSRPGEPTADITDAAQWLTAECERLRGALEKIRDEVDHVGKDHDFTYCNEIARAALATHTHGPPPETHHDLSRPIWTPEDEKT